MHVCKRIVLPFFLAVSALSYIFWIANTVKATPMDVCPSGCTYSTIQDAVDNAIPSDIINVSEGTYAENVVISKTLTIQGVDANTTIVDGTDTDSVFIINSGIAVTLTNMTITNGNSINTSSNGGGIHIDRADVSLIDVIVSNNFASNVGGGVYSFGGNLRILNGQILNNIVAHISGSSFGGGIAVQDDGDVPSQASIVNTTVDNNLAYSDSGSGTGGGIYNASVSALTIENSTISNNESTHAAAGIFIHGAEGFTTKTVTITNSTISGNSAGASGGGIYGTNESDIFLVNTTVVSNTAFWGGGVAIFDTDINLKNALIALNAPDDCASIGIPVKSLDNNLDGDNSCNLTETNDLPAMAPLISPLQNNGGRTETHALLENSPAINAGSNVGCPDVDQRGVLRPQGSTCDIGAYEFEEGITFTDFLYLPMITKQ